jgi:ATP-binding cassette subfamily B protein
MLSIVVFAVLGLSLWLNARLNRPLTSAGKAYQESLGKISAYALKAIEGLMVIKAFRAEEHMGRWFSGRSRGARDNAMAMARRVSLVILAVIGGAFSMVMVFFGFGAYLAVAGKITVGSMLASMFLVDYVIPLGFLGERWADLHKCVGAYERVKEITEAEVDQDLSVDSVFDIGEMPGLPEDRFPAQYAAISVRDPSHEYVPGTKVLDGVSFDVRRGQEVAIVGRSG